MSASWEIKQGDCIELMGEMPDASVDAICTDPPYGIRFMGHAWDGADIEAQAQRRSKQAQPPQRDGSPRIVPRLGRAEAAGTYDLRPNANRSFQGWCSIWGGEALRVLRPGAHMLVFGGTRTFHRLTCGLEDAGFEIRDCLMWLYGSGFPKSRNLDGDRQGWGTALKPAWEPIVLARKPLAGTVAANMAEYRTGALNIDACRIGTEPVLSRKGLGENSRLNDDGWKGVGSRPPATTSIGRWPANVAFGHTKKCVYVGEKRIKPLGATAHLAKHGKGQLLNRGDGAAEHPGFRDEDGMETVEAWECAPGCPIRMLDEQSGETSSSIGRVLRRGVTTGAGMGYGSSSPSQAANIGYDDRGGASRFFYCAKTSKEERNRGLKDRNDHPTVKPVELMRWLVRLITPPEGVVLDPFAGSGTTGIAALREGFSFIGLERDEHYCEIARARIVGDAPLINGACEAVA